MALTMNIQYPEALPDATQQTRNEFEQEARLAMAVKLFELKKISSGIAAGIAGIDRVSFLLTLHKYGAAMLDLDIDELESDVKNVS